MYYNTNGELLHLSYLEWIRLCTGEDDAFVLTPSDDITDEEERKELLYELGNLMDATYPDRKEVKYFPVVKNLGAGLFSNDIAIAIRDVDKTPTLSKKELEELLRENDLAELFKIIPADDYEVDERNPDFICLLGLLDGCTWSVAGNF